MGTVYFVSGIDTDCGKSFATGIVARELRGQGRRVFTQKLVQTGCVGVSSDIVKHREIMGVELAGDDLSMVSCPVVLRYPASPHLAAKLEGASIDLHDIDRCTSLLREKYDILLLEGAGGLFVPITEELLTIDFVAQRQYPLLLVSSGRLGSINHTLMSIELCKSRHIDLRAVLYNNYPPADNLIAADSRLYIERYLQQLYPSALMIDVPNIQENRDASVEGLLL